MLAIQFKDVWEMYRIRFNVSGSARWENFWALKGINFELEKGGILGVVGENGAGKSTILKLIAGMITPDRGEAVVSGKVSGLLELGAGFQPELTGMENIKLLASLFGAGRGSIEDKKEEIAGFADLGKFIYAPVKCYSQGMFVRLAFAVAVHMDPDIFLIDDTLAVGDEFFQRKCIRKIFEIKETGKTIVFVSHDMAMLSRLCKRALFLKDGRIVEDNLVDKVLPLYTRTVGKREGVGVLTKGELSCVFNNGRLFLNLRDQLLTPNSGAYTTLLIKNKWYSSLSADWHVETRLDNKLVARGEFYQLGLVETWRLELTDKGYIQWDVEMESKEPLQIEEGYLNLTLTDQYTRWLTSLERGEFAPITTDNKNWEPLLEGYTFRRCIGVMAEKSLKDKIPSLVFEQSGERAGNHAQIFNTDYLTHSRVLQYKLGGLANGPMAQADRFIYFSGKLMLDIADVEQYVTDIGEEFALIEGPLRMKFDRGRCVLTWNGASLTKVGHIETFLFNGGKSYSSSMARWEFKKEEDNKLIARGRWQGLPMVLIYTIELTRDNSFLLNVDVELQESLRIEEQYLRLSASEFYAGWFCGGEDNIFPPEFLEEREDVLKRCVSTGAVGLRSPDPKYPSIHLSFSKELNNFAKIFNSDLHHRARILEVARVEPEGTAAFAPGRYSCFRVKAEIRENSDGEKFLEDSRQELGNGKLRFVFDKGRARIFFKGTELTKKLGLYTSLRSGNRWYDSVSCAAWKVEEKTGDTIKVEGSWLNLPVKQRWSLKFKDDAFIDLDITMKVEREIGVDRLQTNVMLSEMYSRWKTDKEVSAFPLFKDGINDDWDCVHIAQGASIGVLGQKDKEVLPEVILSPSAPCPGWVLNIVNSDMNHRGRVLQYLNAANTILAAGVYPYFSGRVIVRP